MKIFYTSVLMLALSGVTFADLPFKKKQQPFTTQSPSAVAHTLDEGTPSQRNDLAVQLGIFAPNPSKPGTNSNSPCVNFHHMESRPVVLRSDAENEVVVAESTECESTYIIVFDQAPKSEWRHVQTVRLPSRAQRPEVTFAELIQSGVSEILVHHETSTDSGAVQQENFVVLKLLHDRVEVVLDTTEHSELTLANRSAAETDNLQQTLTSTFSLLKSPPNSAALFRIFEKQVVTDNKTTITRNQVWTWDPELERFRLSPIDGGEVKPAPTPKKQTTNNPAAQKPGDKPVPPPAKPN
jgi:hypothetical protein